METRDGMEEMETRDGMEETSESGEG